MAGCQEVCDGLDGASTDDVGLALRGLTDSRAAVAVYDLILARGDKE